MYLLLTLAVVLAGSVRAAAQEPSSTPNQPPVVVTTGEAVVRRTPDRAFITIAVESRAKNPRDAQRQNAEAMNTVQQRLTQARLPADAIRTLGYDLEQEFDIQPNGRVPKDFVARNTIELRVEEVAHVGELIDTAIRGGATSIAGVRFDLQDRGGAEREAVRLAVADARARADAAAAGAGVRVDRVLRIEDHREGLIGPPRPVVMAARTIEATTPVEPGLIEIRARVTLTASIR
jgi:uncharacterized protein YggE